MASKRLRRKFGGRSLSESAILICYDGEVTEDIYFRGWRQLISPSAAQIEPAFVRSGGNPLKAVKETSKLARRKGAEFSAIWCVTDVDDASDSIIKKAIAEAKKLNIELALTRRCFEVWIMLHFGAHTKPWSTEDEAIGDVRNHFTNYGKPRKQFPFVELFKHTQDALDNANILRNCQIDNPSTDLDILVQKLFNMVKTS